MEDLGELWVHKIGENTDRARYFVTVERFPTTTFFFHPSLVSMGEDLDTVYRNRNLLCGHSDGGGIATTTTTTTI